MVIFFIQAVGELRVKKDENTQQQELIKLLQSDKNKALLALQNNGIDTRRFFADVDHVPIKSMLRVKSIQEKRHIFLGLSNSKLSVYRLFLTQIIRFLT